MSVYRNKLLELIHIHHQDHKYYLQIRLSFDSERDYFWEIDELTASNLLSQCTTNENYKYRLSFHHSWDSIKQQFVSSLTKTYRDHSEKIPFICTNSYIQSLDSIKAAQSQEQLAALNFLTEQNPFQEEEIKETVEIPPPKKQPAFIKLAWAAVFIISILTIGYFSLSTMNLSFKEVKPVKAEALNNKDSNKTMIAAVTVESDQPKDLPNIQVKKHINSSVPKGSVALTFDDGPTKYTQEIMNILVKEEVGGTFFFLGSKVPLFPDEVTFAHEKGFSIGSHSMHHPDFTKLSYRDQEKELVGANKAIEKITENPITMFRPPYGAQNASTIKLTKKYNNKIVLWNIDTLDWKHQNPQKIIKEIKQANTSGAIILLHESQAVIDALPEIIEYLKNKDLEIVNLK